MARAWWEISSLVVLTHLDLVTDARRHEVETELRAVNPHARLTTRQDLDLSLLPRLTPTAHAGTAPDHATTHWASCSVDLPHVPDLPTVQAICDAIPASVLRLKGCTRVGDEDDYTYFERTPDGEVFVRPYRGKPVTGPKLLAVGPGSDPTVLQAAVDQASKPV